MTTRTRQRPTLALRTPQGLRAWRLAHRLTQADLAKLLDVTAQSVYRWESGTGAIARTVEYSLLYLTDAGLLEVRDTLERAVRGQDGQP